MEKTQIREVVELRFGGNMPFRRFMYKLVIYNKCLFNKILRLIHNP